MIASKESFFGEASLETSTITMIRTVCCEGVKTHGKRCSLCPHRQENREAVENYKLAVRRLTDRTAGAASAAVASTVSGVLTEA